MEDRQGGRDQEDDEIESVSTLWKKIIDCMIKTGDCMLNMNQSMPNKESFMLHMKRGHLHTGKFMTNMEIPVCKMQ
jgi:hypothetical protein